MGGKHCFGEGGGGGGIVVVVEVGGGGGGEGVHCVGGADWVGHCV